MKLRLAQQIVERDPRKAEEMLAELKTEANDALEKLRDLARGIYPPLLADKGLAAALEAQARRRPSRSRSRPTGRPLPARGRGRRLLLLARGAPERRQVRRAPRAPDPARADGTATSVSR